MLRARKTKKGPSNLFSKLIEHRSERCELQGVALGHPWPLRPANVLLATRGEKARTRLSQPLKQKRAT